MTQPATGWKIERTCSHCGHREEIEVTKQEAAFELVDINDVLGDTCRQCSSKTFTFFLPKPDLDFALLKEWATSPELYLMEQDEELLLADEKYLEMILQILDTTSIPERKRDVLMEALCVIVYDNTVEVNSKHDDKLRSKVVKELNKRQDKLKLADDWIRDYIKEVVYPQLNLDGQNAL